MVLSLYSTDDLEKVTDSGVMFVVVGIFYLVSVIFFINVLIVQFSSAYGVI